MTIDQLIEGVLQREGGFQADAADRGNGPNGATNFGITSAVWGIYRGFGRRATVDEIKAITAPQAREFYRTQYVTNSPFRFIAYEPLRVQCIDFAVNSGTARAMRWLQRCLDVPVTGVWDDRTQGALTRDRGELVNRALVAARLTMIDRATDQGTVDKKFEHGLTRRALSFAEFAEGQPV